MSSAGNAAGTGALIALLNQRARDEIEQVIGRVEKVETAVEADFQAQFVGAMGIPHATDPFPHLAEAVRLPPPKILSAARDRRRTRRRGGGG